MGHMSDDDYYKYGQNAYAGSGDCSYVPPSPVPAGCWSQAMSHQPVSHQAAPQHYQPAPVQTPSHSYVQSAPVQQHSYSAPQTYSVPQTQSYSTPTYSAPTYSAPVHPAPVTVQNYEQQYVQTQPTYTTGGYGTHAGTSYQVPHQPMRGYYGVAPAPKTSGFYVQGYGGVNLQGESSNTGISGPFTTGNIGDGTTINVADGTEYGWETDFDTGSVFGAEAGYRSGKGWRVGLEGTRSEASVEGHEEILLGGTDIGGFDGATLVGAGTPLGATVNDFLADAQGNIEQKGVFLNGYYDFNQGKRFRPYVGAGIGMVDVDVDYSPSGSPVINGGETLFGYQGRVGAAYNVTGPIDVFTEYTYRATQDIETNNELFTGDLDIENSQSLVTVGARYNF